MNSHQQLILTIKDYFQDKPVKKAYLFGSQLGTNADEKSDVDILVELDHSEPIGLKFIRMKLELEDILQKKVDLVSENGVSKYIQPFIKQNRLLIYER